LVLPALKHAQKQQRTAYYQQTLNNYAGYPASAAQLQNSEVYEVTAVWQDQTHPTNFFTLIREKGMSIRLYNLPASLSIGFYRADANGQLSSLQSATLETK